MKKTDLTTPDFVTQLDKDGYDQIYHLAAINGTENFYKIPHKVLKVGIMSTIHLLDWFVQSGRGRFLFTSSSEVYAGALKLLGDRFPVPTPEDVPLVVDDPTNTRWSYGASKILSEVAIHSYARGLGMSNWTIVRYHNIYGPRMGFEHVIPQFIERAVKRENPFRIFGGQETRTFCYIDDAVAATQLIMEHPQAAGQTIHIGRSDGEIKMLDLAGIVCGFVGHRPQMDVQLAPNGAVMRRCPDITKLKQLGYAPKVSLEDGARRTYDWYEGKFN